MKIIAHRRNTLKELIETDPKYGIEVDIRSQGQNLIIHHDAFAEGELFENWLKAYRHDTLILNVKEEGLERKLIELMASQKISDYFFLDQSFPFIIKWSGLGERRCAVRISEYESIYTVLSLAGRLEWVWVDCFTHFPLNGLQAKTLQQAGFKLCLVSPELQGRNAEIEIPELIRILNQENIKAEAVCTKRPDIWENMVLKS